jgi:hypothetical protein
MGLPRAAFKQLTNGAASNRQIARTLGVDHQTLNNDLGKNLPLALNDANDLMLGSGKNLPRPLSGEQAARLVKRHWDCGWPAAIGCVRGQHVRTCARRMTVQ